MAEFTDEDDIADIKFFYFDAIKNTVIGFLFGFLIDRLFSVLQKKFNINVLIIVPVQIIVLIGMLYVIRRFIIPHEGTLWQKTTSGILFASFYFGAQVNLFNYFHKALEDIGL